MITAAVALVVDVVAVVLLLLFTDLGIYSLLVAMIIYAVVVCILNDRAMKKYLRYKNPWRFAYLNQSLHLYLWELWQGLYIMVCTN